MLFASLRGVTYIPCMFVVLLTLAYSVAYACIAYAIWGNIGMAVLFAVLPGIWPGVLFASLTKEHGWCWTVYLAVFTAIGVVCYYTGPCVEPAPYSNQQPFPENFGPLSP